MNSSVVTADSLCAPSCRRIAPFCPELASLPRMPRLEKLCRGASSAPPPVTHNVPVVIPVTYPVERCLRTPRRRRVCREPVRFKKLTGLESLLLAAAASDDDD
ncbi:hypothetical protein BOTBODRAFT_189180 [Botryobasidium botryosum FD-172 SS1]|uniref:Uncharacterized protein n=1 Tax=Botryobasidium botryosum (strain FD-172 SS1) TaxID=930990 RepID=A0A067MLK0_BOTB1|nr:hypothetical protein BOTBODRAFT_189180 [Botryobasidium botryosum FD-172 SS1]